MWWERTFNTADTKQAAAFRTLDFPVKAERIVDEQNSRTDIRYHIGALSKKHPEVGDAPTLRDQLKSGLLEERDPAHPLLICMRANRNRDRLLDMMNGRVNDLQLLKHPGCELWTYERGGGAMCGMSTWAKSTGCAPVVKTPDFKMVAALGVLGFGVIDIEGSAGSRQFYVPKWRPGVVAATDEAADVLVQRFRSYDLLNNEPGHPLLWAMFCLQWRAKYRRDAERQAPHVMLEKPGTKKKAFIKADAPDAEWDRARKHFGA